jgi:PhnB protein
MSVQLNPYLNFRNNTREAMEFYREVFGGTLTVSTFGENHASADPSEDDLVMHSQLDGDNGVVFMASDTPPRMDYRPGSNFSMSLSGDDDALLSGWYQRLADGGTVTMPLEKAPWGDTFGMCVDRFGVSWLVNISGSSGGGES